MCSRWFCWIALASSAMAATSTDSQFALVVQPLLAANCGSCHSAKLKTSGFSIGTMESVMAGGNKYRGAVIAGDPSGSPLIKILKGQLTPRMPVGKVLPDAEIAKIEHWIAELRPGAVSNAPPRDPTWALRKPTTPVIPTVGHADWVSNPIDSFVLGKLEQAHLTPAPAASKRVLARRVYLDLLGMPPTVEELNAFLNDPAPDAYPKLIDKLLADPRYGEKWGRHWLDLVRYGETSGLEGDGAIGNAWRYRDWVIDAFNSDMPYDQFVIKQLAGGDEHSLTRNNYVPDIQGYVPTGFLRLAPWDRSNLVADEVRQNYLNEVTTATGSVFLGLTIGCARCHDHKYDPIPTKDFYRLQAFFNAVKVEDVDVPYKDKAFAAQAEARIKDYEERLRSGREKRELDEFEGVLLKRWIAARASEAQNRELTVADLRLELRRKKQEIFSDAEVGKHQELLEDADRTQDVEQRKLLDSLEQRLLTKLAEAVKSGQCDNSARYQELKNEDLRAEVAKPGEKYFAEAEKERHRELSGKVAVYERRIERLRPKTLSVINAPGPPIAPGLPLTHVLISGDYRQPGEAVEPGFPSAITGNSEPAVLETDRYRQFPTRGRRVTLAKWIATDNPLTARVMVNRIWQHHFGRGIVETASDFGKNGSAPTHPELLDWLANKFVEERWSVKQMHRLMMNSSTYRQAAENRVMSRNTSDPENKLLWCFNRRRMEAEEIRDSVLYVSGRLNLARGGPSVFPPLPADLADFARYGRTGGAMWEPNEMEQDNRRRSIYTFQRRSLPQPMMLAFDAPIFSESCERRSVTTTALQALSMMNGDLVNDEALHLADRVASQAGPDRSAQVKLAFEMVLNRPPSVTERAKFASFPGPLAGICRVLLNSNEFLYVE